MLDNVNIIPLTSENIDIFFKGDEWGYYCIGTIDVRDCFKGEPNKAGYLKEELTKRLNTGFNLHFQYELVPNH
jgi:hypothetical protein